MDFKLHHYQTDGTNAVHVFPAGPFRPHHRAMICAAAAREAPSAGMTLASRPRPSPVGGLLQDSGFKVVFALKLFFNTSAQFEGLIEPECSPLCPLAPHPRFDLSAVLCVASDIAWKWMRC